MLTDSLVNKYLPDATCGTPFAKRPKAIESDISPYGLPAPQQPVKSSIIPEKTGRWQLGKGRG